MSQFLVFFPDTTHLHTTTYYYLYTLLQSECMMAYQQHTSSIANGVGHNEGGIVSVQKLNSFDFQIKA